MADIIITMSVGIEYSPSEINVREVLSCPLSIICNHDHQLASRETVGTEVLNNEMLITINEDDSPFSVDRLKALLAKFNAHPKDIIIANSLESQILMVESGFGVALLPSIKNIPLSGFVSSDFTVFIKHDNNNPAARLFYNLLSSAQRDAF